ncbi:MAG TPA: amylo-alpha-1,6-glucosidase [Verrucomicrobiae bacterium]|jgi:glycogen debranching enzyme
MSEIIEVQGQYYIRASASIADAGTRVLKHGDTFSIFDRHGDIRPLGFENQGLFCDGTRYLSRWKFRINGVSPLLLSSNVKEDNDLLVVDMTNTALPIAGGKVIPHGAIHIVRTILLWEGDFFERIEISSFALQPILFTVDLDFDADYVDLFEIRGTKREKHGELLESTVTPSQVNLGYRGLDAVVRRTRIQFNEPARDINRNHAVFEMTLEPQQKKRLEFRVSCESDSTSRNGDTFDSRFAKVHADYKDFRAKIAPVETSNPQFNDWLHQSRADLHMLLTRTSNGLYPYAGIPWFSCIFGRDGIITAMETLWVYPEIARGVLAYLAAKQASEINEARDAEPGKILHEERKGEMVALGEVPFGCYYGSIDSTPLWLILAGRYYERTGDKDFIAHLWPNIERALAWIDVYGDCDGDGFVEYRQRAHGGLNNQGWKDSEDAVFHADGTLATAPIALCEVQGYVYEAKIWAAQIAEVLGRREQAEKLRESAERLKKRFHEAFWCDDIGMYAIALDGAKRPCRVRSSNAGQCLFTGIAQPEAAGRIKDNIISESFFSGWGVRTIAISEARFNPMSYHNGSIWPHDNALIAYGLARYGFKDAALRILDALFDASQFVDMNRLPELYCGFARRPGEGPTHYPVACNPQAWASASVFLLLTACVGLRIEALRDRVYFNTPRLPSSLHYLDIKGLRVGSGEVDVSLVRHDREVAVNVGRRVGKIEVIVVH